MKHPKPNIRQRVTVSIAPSSDAKEEVELDYRLLVAGDFSGSAVGENKLGTSLKDREKITIRNKGDFNNALKKINPELNINVSDKLSDDPDKQIPVNLAFDSMKAFHPDDIVKKVPALQDLLKARDQLKELKVNLLKNVQLKKAVEDSLKSIQDGDSKMDDLLGKLKTEENSGDDKKNSGGNKK